MTDKVFIKDYTINFTDEGDDEAFASLANNSQFNYLKFILTDDKPNANKQRVPPEEFDNLVKSGAFAPFKVTEGSVEDHLGSTPIGVITNLAKANDQVRGIAALWSSERPDDVEMIKQAYANKQPLNVSWEIRYQDSRFTDDGVEDLLGTSLRAATLVKVPAYQGRTPVIAVASADPEPKKEDKTLDELQQLREQLAQLNDQLASLKKEAEEQKAALDAALPELTQLREYKASIEKEKADAEKFASIKTKFVEAGITKEDDYFVANKEKLMALDEATLDFMIQELVSFASTNKPAAASVAKVPNMPSEGDEELTPAKLAEALRARFQK